MSLAAPARVLSTLGALTKRLDALWRLVQENGIPRLMLVLVLLTVVFGVALFSIERDATEEAQITSLENGLWWAFVTMTTTGYGDLVPKTTVGRIFASLTMLAGMAVTSILTASIASALVARNLRLAQGLAALDLKDHTIIGGWNDRAAEVLDGFAAAGEGPPIALVNQLPDTTHAELRARYRRAGINVVSGDHSDAQVLERAGLGRAAAVILLADSVGAAGREDDRTLVSVLTTKSLNPEVSVTAELRHAVNEASVRQAGAENVVLARQDSGFFLASAAFAPGLGAAAREMLRGGGEAEIRRAEFPLALRGRTYAEAFAAYRQQGVLLLGIVTESATITLDSVLGSGSDWVSAFVRRMLTDASEQVLGEAQEKAQVLIGPDDTYEIGAKDAALVIMGSISVG